MTINLLVILCQILVSTHAALVIEVQPSRIQPGLTNNLVINCSITDNKVPQMLKIYSLALSRVISSDNDTLEELIVLNYNENNSSLKTSKVPEGSVGFNDASHISLSWPNPSYRDANRYKCEARGLSHNFNKISAAAYLSVETDVPDIKGLVDELFHLRKESYRTVNALKEVQERCRPQNDALDKSVNKLIAQKQMSMKSLFYSSNQYKGRRYYLSRRHASVEINIAQAT
ncbi:fibrinogen-related protein K2 precursor, partial [Biomphalaria glabrata]